MTHETDAEYDARTKRERKKEREERNAEMRRRRRTPRGVQRANDEKTSGPLSFFFLKDCAELRIVTTRANTKDDPASAFLMAVLAKAGFKTFNTTNGRMLAEYKFQDPAAVRRMLKVADVPEPCERCAGYGWLDYAGKGADKSFTSYNGKACPACHGSGRALTS